MKLGWIAGHAAALVCAFGVLGCSQDPEDFCNSKVEELCKVLGDCCESGTEFDLEECRLSISQSCQSALKVEQVHAGDVQFDSGAASSCYPKIESCDDLSTVSKTTVDQYKACQNMVTGYRPPGAACSDSSQCEKAGGDFPFCHAGRICAKGIISEDECGFSLENNEIRICTEGKYCDQDEKKYSPSDPPTAQELEFSGSCKDYPGKGGKCLPDGMNPIPCADGYYCDFDATDPKSSTCKALKAKGEECNGSNCGEGLVCEYDGMKEVCVDQPVSGPYCFSPPKCGDGVCQDPSEDTTSCPADCGGCGDGICDFGGDEPATCPVDCCGDGFCDTGETPEICPADCP